MCFWKAQKRNHQTNLPGVLGTVDRGASSFSLKIETCQECLTDTDDWVSNRASPGLVFGASKQILKWLMRH